MLRLNVIYYGQPSPETDSRIIGVRPQYLVCNPPHGLYGEMNGYEGDMLMRDLDTYRANGIKMIGYLTGGYEGTMSGGGLGPEWYSLELNRKLVRNMALEDRVDGVFIDECSAFPDSESRKYLSALTTEAHQLGLTTWGNTGADEFDPWFLEKGGFDLMNSTEDWQGGELSRVQHQWGSRVSVTGFKRWYTPEDAFRLTVDAWNKGLACCYITSEEYVSLAPWFEEYARMLREHLSRKPRRNWYSRLFGSGRS
ncbi:MAG: hypothetical protein IBX68_04640 [Dehalococcoidia bacterium]|nr:hypothetical protein [Dehalococcoidia bacterium]